MYNPFFRSYTKLQLRYLVIDPNFELSKLSDIIRPTDIKPMSRKQFADNVRMLVSKGYVKFTLNDFLNKRFDRSTLPACWCRDILIHLIGE